MPVQPGSRSTPYLLVRCLEEAGIADPVPLARQLLVLIEGANATRERILDTAEELFYLRGISAVGIAEIAEVAQASKMSIYKNFGSKEGLVDATLRRRSERVARWLTEGVSRQAPRAGRVLTIFDLLAGWFAERHFRGCAMVGAAAEDRVADTVSTRLARAHLRTYRDLLVRCLEEAGVADPVPLARQLLVLIAGATIVSAIDADPSVAADARAAAGALLAAGGSSLSRSWEGP